MHLQHTCYGSAASGLGKYLRFFSNVRRLKVPLTAILHQPVLEMY